MATTKSMTNTSPAQPVESAEARGGRTFAPAVDVFETREAFELVADIPGAARDSISVACHQGQLEIEAHVPPRYPEGSSAHRVEYGVGNYRRVFRLGEDVDTDRIEASYSGGILTVRLPKAPAARARRIDVKAG